MYPSIFYSFLDLLFIGRKRDMYTLEVELSQRNLRNSSDGDARQCRRFV